MMIFFLKYQKNLAWTIWVMLLSILSILNILPFFHENFWAALKDRDFANYWLAGQLIYEGKVSLLFSDMQSYMAQLSAHIGSLVQPRYWSYPPHYLFFMIPLGYLTYYQALAAFMFVGLIFFLLSSRVFTGKLTATKMTLLLPFILCQFFVAQNGFLTGGLFLLSLGWREKRPVLSGVALGLLTIKPQLGVLLPVLFLVEKRYTAISSAIVTTCLLVLSSILVFGQDAWISYIEISLPFMKAVMWKWQGLFLMLMPSLFASLRSLGVDPTTAFTVHILCAAFTLAGFALYFYLKRSIKLDAYIIIILTFLLSPYFFVYDIGPLMVVAAALVDTTPDMRTKIIAAIVALIPLACLPMGLLQLPLAPFLIFALLLVVLERAISFDPLGRSGL
jgi:arabinofuranan 3-O-arabinosyltransferase